MIFSPKSPQKHTHTSERFLKRGEVLPILEMTLADLLWVIAQKQEISVLVETLNTGVLLLLLLFFFDPHYLKIVEYEHKKCVAKRGSYFLLWESV